MQARMLGLKPGFCQVKVPAETLPVCGQGSGVNPPCWHQRFSVAKVQLNDGSQILFERDDSNVATDSKKGYRAWKRQDLKLLLEMQQLTVNSSISGLGAGVDVNLVLSRAEKIVRCDVISVTKLPDTTSQMVAMVPRATEYLQTYTQLLQSDWLFTPATRLSADKDLVSAKAQILRVASVPSFLANSGSDSMSFSQADGSYAAVPFDEKNNAPKFTVDLWLLLRKTPSAVVPIIRSVGKGGSGFALLLTEDGRCQFWLGTGLSSHPVPHPSFSVLNAACDVPQERLLHVVLTFDGLEQIIYIDGAAQNSTRPLPFAPNQESALHIGGECAANHTLNGGQFLCLVDGASRSAQFFEGSLDEILIYSSALSPACVRGHARFAQQRLHALFKVGMSGFNGMCAGNCSLQLSAGLTPNVFGISPVLGWSGKTVTITGQGFTLGHDAPVVQIGSRLCSITSRTDSSVICSIQAPTDPQETLGLVKVVVVFADLGQSVEPLMFTLTSTIISIAPTAGSILGGTVLTITAAGVTSDVERIKISAGSHHCKVRSSQDNTVQCELDMMQHSVAGTWHVSMQVDGIDAVCSALSGVCEWQSLSSETPTVETISPFNVSEGSVLTLTGNNLPLVQPYVRIGTIPCTVTSNSSTKVACVVGPGGGGRHLLTVLYPQGFATYTSNHGCCPLLPYSFELSGIVPAQGSRYGGQLVTLSGSSFPDGSLRVSIGGKICKLQNRSATTIILETPEAAEAEQTGVEIHALESLQTCARYNTTTTCDFSSFGLRACESALFAALGETSPSDASANVMMLAPPSDSRDAHETFLIDSDPSTVWHSKNGENALKIAIDLREARKFSGLTVSMSPPLTCNFWSSSRCVCFVCSPHGLARTPTLQGWLYIGEDSRQLRKCE